MNKFNMAFGFLMVLFVVLVVFLTLCFWESASAQSKQKIVIVNATDHSNYVIDTEYGLCFYETFTAFSTNAVYIPCIHSKKLLDVINANR